MNDGRNTCGQAYALTVLTPILEGHESALARYLGLLQSGAASPLAAVRGTHFARWVVIDDVVYGGPSQKRDHLKLGRLLFTSNFDGPVEPYLAALRTGLGEAADAIWSHCAGYPGSDDAAAFGRYLRMFLRIEDLSRAVAWISEITEDVLTAAPWSAKPASGVNIAFSFSGLRAMGLPDASLAGFPEEFRQGMAARAQLLGDVGESAPANWEGGFGTADIHVLVMISAMHEPALDAHDERLRASLERSGGLTLAYTDIGVALPDGREHFGYVDGFAQPSIVGAGAPALPGQGAPAEGGQWRPISAGEFILGYPDEQGVLPAAPPPAELSANSTYLVYRKLRQDVAVFRARLAESARLYQGGEELLAAKIVGRWRDGTPLDLSAARPDPAIVADEQRNNAFSYSDDAGGQRCPIGAHVRRANPRLGLPFEGPLVNRHRLIRRGIPYGKPLPPGAADDGGDRGVIFMCLQASIARQFEFVQSQWLGDGNAFGLGEDQDVMLGVQDGTAPKKMTVPGDPPFFLGPLSRVVTVKGGEYFFVPGINGLHFLAAAAGGGAA